MLPKIDHFVRKGEKIVITQKKLEFRVNNRKIYWKLFEMAREKSFEVAEPNMVYFFENLQASKVHGVKNAEGWKVSFVRKFLMSYDTSFRFEETI